jgi:2-polyprenyl-3-methyl-5-hydroxy-6-metoxy-1,4-benzoquinol methylase
MKSDSPTCPCCISQETRDLGRLPDVQWFAGNYFPHPLTGGHLHLCHHCKLRFRHPRLDDATYAQLYSDGSSELWASDAQRPDFKQIAQTIREIFPEGGRVLDFGCHTGTLLSMLEPRYETHGIEINHAAAAIAATRVSGRILPFLSEMPSHEHFDVIVASNVIEHLPSPAQFMAELATHLAPGGILILTSGDADNHWWRRFGANWWYCFYAEHIVFFSRETLDHLCGVLGLSALRWSTFRYTELPPLRRSLAWALAGAYGHFPFICLTAISVVRKLLGKPAYPASAPGNGVTNDHFLAVLEWKPDADD